MNRLDILKQAKAKIEALNAKKEDERASDDADVEAVKLALLLESNQDITDAIERTALSKSDLAEAVAQIKIEVPKIDAPQVTVNVPEIQMPPYPAFPAYPDFPEIKLPTINVPEPRVTVNVPEQKAPIVNVEAPVVNFPDSMDVGLDRYSPKTPLHVMSVGPDGKFVSPTSGGGGPRQVKATLQKSKEEIGIVDIKDDRLSVFGELISVQLTPVFQYSFEYTVDNSSLFSTVAANGGTITDATSMAVVSTSTTTDSDALLQTKKAAKYRAGQGASFRFTALFTDGVADTVQLAGLAGDLGSSEAFANGYMIGFVGTTFGVHRFYDDARETIALADCNDPLDGNGKSGMRINTDKINVFEIRFQYLGAGKIEYAIEDDKTGKFIVFHTINYTNRNTRPSVGNPNFYGTFFVDNKTTTSDMTLKTASCAYFVQGLTNLLQTHQPVFASGAITTTTTANNETAVLTVRNGAQYFGKTNYIEAILYGISVGVDANAANNLTSVRLVRNATLGGSQEYSKVSEYNSIMEKDVYGTTVTGGEDAIDFILAGQRDSQVLKVNEWELLLEPEDTWTIATSSTANATVKVSLIWKELF